MTLPLVLSIPLSLSISLPLLAKLDDIQEDEFYGCITRKNEECKTMRGKSLNILYNCIVSRYKHCLVKHKKPIPSKLKCMRRVIQAFDSCIRKQYSILRTCAKCLLEWYEKYIKDFKFGKQFFQPLALFVTRMYICKLTKTIIN